MKKKNTKKKPAANKRAMAKIAAQSPSISAAADQDIAGLLMVLVRKLTLFEAKIDMVLSRVSAPPAPGQQPLPAASLPVIPHNKPNRDYRPMYQAVCADCGKDCEVPFKPRGDRPVYCKECFTKRKSKGIFRPQETIKPKEEPAASAAPAPAVKPKAAANSKPAKYTSKKKPAAKKKAAKK